jgi:hypothetical protein
MPIFRLLACLLLLAILPLAAGARQTGPDPAPASAPSDVTIGMLLNRVDAIDLKANRFDVDFYIWFVWSDPDIDPGESWEIVNGHVKQKTISDAHPVAGGRYASYRVQATIIHEFDLYKYPRDRHRLEIQIEDATPAEKLVYQADTAASNLNQDFFAPGFVGGQASFTVAPHVYRTNYGDPDIKLGNASVFSRFSVGFSLWRPSSASAFKLYIGVFVAAMIGFLGLLARADLTDVRFGLGSAALFAAIATQFVIATSMPDTSILTVPDLICIITIGYVFLTLLESGVSLCLLHAGREQAARRLDFAALALLGGSYMALCLWLVLG